MSIEHDLIDAKYREWEEYKKAKENDIITQAELDEVALKLKEEVRVLLGYEPPEEQ